MSPQIRESMTLFEITENHPETIPVFVDEGFPHMADPAKRPVFVHCKHGADRTGTMVAFYRILFEGWSKDEAIREMKKEMTTAVISNYTPVLRGKINEVWKIGEAFDHLVVSSEVGVMKPAAEIYRIALEKAGASADESIFVDDFIENVAGARQEGLAAIHFQDAGQARSALEKLLTQDSGAQPGH